MTTPEAGGGSGDRTAGAIAPLTANFILYCRRFAQTRAFYADVLGLPIVLDRGWFVEFALNEGARLSVADERRASIRAAGGDGLTVTLQTPDADEAHALIEARGARPEPPRAHPWGGRAFFVRDPDGHRVEIWSG